MSSAGTYQSCRDALSRSVSVCGRPNHTEEYRQCMEEKMNIILKKSCDVENGESPCVLSGDDVTFCIKCPHPSTTARIVHGVAGMYGGPSKLTG